MAAALTTGRFVTTSRILRGCARTTSVDHARRRKPATNARADAALAKSTLADATSAPEELCFFWEPIDEGRPPIADPRWEDGAWHDWTSYADDQDRAGRVVLLPGQEKAIADLLAALGN